MEHNQNNIDAVKFATEISVFCNGCVYIWFVITNNNTTIT